MSFTKEALSSSVGAGGSAWLDASPSRRCFACDGSSWCQIARDDSAVLCKRNDSGRAKVNRDGVTFYVHRRDGAAPRWTAPPPQPSRERAPIEVCDRAYRALLSALPLAQADLDGLVARGLDRERIVANRYRTLPDRERARLARVVIDAVGEDDAAHVPMMVRRTAGDGSGRSWWSVAGWGGLLVPVRDAAGRVAALKVRRRDGGDGPRYTYLSSARGGGAAAASVVHHPLEALSLRARSSRVVVTEGPLKGDVASALLHLPVVAIPGVGAWAEGVEAALALGAETVALALDMDAMTNKRVALAAQLMVDELRRAGARTELWQWDARWKGVDDYALALTRGEVIHAT